MALIKLAINAWNFFRKIPSINCLPDDSAPSEFFAESIRTTSIISKDICRVRSDLWVWQIGNYCLLPLLSSFVPGSGWLVLRVLGLRALRSRATKRPNPAVNRTAQKLRFWVPSALRAPAAGYLGR